jgi:hypothetical protein
LLGRSRACQLRRHPRSDETVADNYLQRKSSRPEGAGFCWIRCTLRPRRKGEQPPRPERERTDSRPPEGSCDCTHRNAVFRRRDRREAARAGRGRLVGSWRYDGMATAFRLGMDGRAGARRTIAYICQKVITRTGTSPAIRVHFGGRSSQATDSHAARIRYEIVAIGRNLVGEAALDSNHPAGGWLGGGRREMCPLPRPTTQLSAPGGIRTPDPRLRRPPLFR